MPMAFFYVDGQLKVGTPESYLDVETLARSAEGPAYIYDLDSVERRISAFKEAFKGTTNSIHYAMKANNHREILRCLLKHGAGVDTVSGGEIRLAVAAGIPPERIVFSGVAKTRSEIELALGLQIKQINVESPQELERIGTIASEMKRVADVAFRLNPDVNPKTHPYITTGFRENKFGMDESFLPELVSILSRFEKNLRLRGLTIHIGSLLFDIDVFREAIEKTIKVHRKLEGMGFQLDRLDIGGGLGIRYETDDESEEFELIRKYGAMVLEVTRDLKAEILTEPGRIIVGRAGILVGEVQYVKSSPAKNFVILNTGMHHFLRPALYGAKHRILPVRSKNGEKLTYDIVGPICESSDFLGKDVELSFVNQGDLIAVADAGAYGYTMASRYNAHELPREIVVQSGTVIA